MPNGAGQPLICSTWTPAAFTRRNTSTALASSRTEPISEIQRCGSGPLGASISTAAVLSGTRIGSTSVLIVPPHVVDVVGADRRVHAMREHEREGEQAEPDHDRGQDERLRNRIGIGLRERRARLRARPAAAPA